MAGIQTPDARLKSLPAIDPLYASDAKMENYQMKWYLVNREGDCYGNLRFNSSDDAMNVSQEADSFASESCGFLVPPSQ